MLRPMRGNTGTDGCIETVGERGAAARPVAARVGGPCAGSRDPFRRRMRGLFGLGVRALGGSDRRNADLAGIDLRTIRNDGAAPGIACIGRIGSLLGLDVASACAIVAEQERRPRHADAAHGGLVARIARADRCDDLCALADLADIVAARASRPCELGLARLAIARCAAARGETARVLPLLAQARSTGVPRAAADVSRRLARQARADLALGTPWRAIALPAAPVPSVRTSCTAVMRARFAPVALLVGGSGACGEGGVVALRALLAVSRGMITMDDPSSSREADARIASVETASTATARPGAGTARAARAHRLDRIWSIATGGLLAVRIVEWAFVRGERAIVDGATTLVAHASLALEDSAGVPDLALRTLAIARLARLQLAEWALRHRIGETDPADCLASDRAEIAALLHRFPLAATESGLARLACLQGRGFRNFQRIAY
jgi:hypothetical protein